MPKNLTQNHLILLLFENIAPKERIEMLALVNSDWTLKESYQELKRAYCAMKRVVKKPSEATISRILDYSQSHVNRAQA